MIDCRWAPNHSDMQHHMMLIAILFTMQSNEPFHQPWVYKYQARCPGVRTRAYIKIQCCLPMRWILRTQAANYKFLHVPVCFRDQVCAAQFGLHQLLLEIGLTSNLHTNQHPSGVLIAKYSTSTTSSAPILITTHFSRLLSYRHSRVVVALQLHETPSLDHALDPPTSA